MTPTPVKFLRKNQCLLQVQSKPLTNADRDGTCKDGAPAEAAETTTKGECGQVWAIHTAGTYQTGDIEGFYLFVITTLEFLSYNLNIKVVKRLVKIITKFLRILVECNMKFIFLFQQL